MLRARSVRRVALLLLCLALVPLGPSWARESAIPGPVHAGNTFGWYPAAWRDEFVGPLKSVWHRHGKGKVFTKNGMFTMLAGHHGHVSATLDMAGHATGRWEIRWKARERKRGHGHYTLRTELVPAGDREQYCGARDIALESYTMAHPRMKFYIHNLPNLAFRAAKRRTYAGYSHDHWHTFAVEVTRSRISWFVDAKVVRSETRPEALSGVPFTVKLSMDGVPGVRMTPATMQLDWMRYWTLAKPNHKSVAAPKTAVGTYKKACPPVA